MKSTDSDDLLGKKRNLSYNNYTSQNFEYASNFKHRRKDKDTTYTPTSHINLLSINDNREIYHDLMKIKL